jgi:hypothetical protein
MYEEYMYEEYMYDSTGLERVFDWLYQRMNEKCIMKSLELRNERKICCITRFKMRVELNARLLVPRK